MIFEVMLRTGIITPFEKPDEPEVYESTSKSSSLIGSNSKVSRFTAPSFIMLKPSSESAFKLSSFENNTEKSSMAILPFREGICC